MRDLQRLSRVHWSYGAVALQGLQRLAVVNKQRQVPESLDRADLGSGASGM